jgi:hypothetical protein
MQNESESGEKPADCGIPNVCERPIPAWLIVLDNAPTLAMFGLGTALIWPVSPPGAIVYLAYCALSIVLFWARICPYCRHFDTRACPCGYGVVASRLFRRKEGRDFQTVFRRNIGIMFPCWIVPLVGGGFLLGRDFSKGALWLFVAFCIVGFVLIPGIAKLIGCRNCRLKDECPWMKGARGPAETK